MEESILNDDSIVFRSCEETHVFPNENGSITIKQIIAFEDDVLIIIPVEHAEKLIKAIRNAKKDLVG